MNETILNLLIHLFNPSEPSHAPYDKDGMMSPLMDFEPYDILSALEWLKAFREPNNSVIHVKNASKDSQRIYLDMEQIKIPTKARVYLETLCKNGIMNTQTRENVIHRIMAIDTPMVTLKQVKWMTLLTCCHQHQFESLTQHMTDVIDQLELFES